MLNLNLNSLSTNHPHIFAFDQEYHSGAWSARNRDNISFENINIPEKDQKEEEDQEQEVEETKSEGAQRDRFRTISDREDDDSVQN